MEFSEFKRRVRMALRRPGQEEVVEVFARIARDIAGSWQTGRGGRFFPCNRVEARVFEPDPARAAAALLEAGTLQPSVLRLLRQMDCAVPGDLRITVVVEGAAAPAGAAGYELRFADAGKPAPSKTPGGETVPYLRVLRGKAGAGEFAISEGRTTIGRLAEVADENGRAVRWNEIWFPQSGHPSNATVARDHAHLEYGPAAGVRIFQDNMRSVITIRRRGGACIVSPLAGGTLLEHGDEILLGAALLRFELRPAQPAGVAAA